MAPEKCIAATTSFRMMRAVDLLQLEMDLLWGTDAYGRNEPPPLIALAAATDGWAVRVSPAVSPTLATRLQAGGRASSGSGDPSRRPPELDRFAELLAPLGPTTVTCGPSYLVQSTPALPSEAQLFTSAQPAPSLMSAGRPRAWWQPHEWEDLMAGRLGPWAIAMDGPRVVALCHTPRAGHGAAEAGVWTHPDARRRGHATAVTAAWAGIARRDHGVLFYSTSERNSASQGVARRLGLRPLGWIWQVHVDPAARDPRSSTRPGDP